MLKDKSNMTSTVLYTPIQENEMRKTLNRTHYECWNRGLSAFAADKDIRLPKPGNEQPGKENTA